MFGSLFKLVKKKKKEVLFKETQQIASSRWLAAFTTPGLSENMAVQLIGL